MRVVLKTVVEEVVWITAGVHHLLAVFGNRRVVQAVATPALGPEELESACSLLREKFRSANVPMRRRLLRTLVPLVTHFHDATPTRHEYSGDRGNDTAGVGVGVSSPLESAGRFLALLPLGAIVTSPKPNVSVSVEGEAAVAGQEGWRGEPGCCCWRRSGVAL